MLDTTKLAAVMTDFEHGGDLTEGNPFDSFVTAVGAVQAGDTGGADQAAGEASSLLSMVDAFVTGNAVPETARYLPPDANQDHGVSFAIAGMLQGLALGYEYAQREAA